MAVRLGGTCSEIAAEVPSAGARGVVYRAARHALT